MQSDRPRKKSSLWKWIAAALLAVGAIAILWTLLPLGSWMASGTRAILSFGWAAIPLFIVVYVLLSLCGFPATPLNIASGVMFGYFAACLTAMAAAFLAAMATFFVARYLARDWVERRIEGSEKALAVFALIKDGGFRIVFLARLNPFIPAIVKSYAFGITAIRPSRYALATVLGQFPVILVHVYLGWAGLAMLDGSTPPGQVRTVLLIAGVVVSLVLLIVISWYGHKQLDSRSTVTKSPTAAA